MLRRPRYALRVLPAVALVAVLAACSNTQSPVNRRPNSGTATASEAGGVQQVTIDATDLDKFVPSTIYVHTGRMVKIVLVHTGTGAPHNWQLNGFPGASVPLVTAQGQEASSTFMAPSPGKYEFVCSIHLRQGQTGTLVVLP